MNGINASAVNQFLQRRLTITDSPGPASTLAPEVMPVILVVPPGQEDLYLRGERLAGVGVTTGAVAANYATCILENPTGSRMMVMIEEIRIGTATNGATHEHYLEDAANSIPGIGAYNSGVLDGRWALGTKRAAAIYRSGNDPNAPAITWAPFAQTRFLETGGENVYRFRVTLSPGRVYMCRNVAVNQALGCSIIWRERPAEPSELV